MGRDTGIADRLRAAGLRVVEVAGWQTAGSDSFAPAGSVNHHTAGPSSGATPSLLTCIEGRPDLPGPLCNVFQSRESGAADVAYVIASGRANHAGDGGWKGLSGNASVYGLEIEHDGVTPLPQARIDYAARIHAAMFTGDPAYVCQHREWTSRKIDAATNVDGADFRNRVAAARNPDESEDFVLQIWWFRRSDGSRHAYALCANQAKHLDGDGLELLAAFGVPEYGPIDANWWNTMVVLDGPCQNVGD
jgi:hypothetical protein